jgi:hypothetical protein
VPRLPMLQCWDMEVVTHFMGLLPKTNGPHICCLLSSNIESNKPRARSIKEVRHLATKCNYDSLAFKRHVQKQWHLAL